MKVKNVDNFAFQNSLIPLINKPTRVTRTNATAIDHILINAFLNKQIETGIIKTEISNHFPIFLITDPITLSEIKSKRTLLYKRTINTATKENFKNILARKTWDYIKEIDNPNEAYSKFLYDFSSIYEEAFPKLEIKIKQKNLISPWITKGIMKSSKSCTVLPCFSKILERTMYNRLYLYLTENNLLYKKQFGFQKGHSTDHARSTRGSNTRNV